MYVCKLLNNKNKKKYLLFLFSVHFDGNGINSIGMASKPLSTINFIK